MWNLLLWAGWILISPINALYAWFFWDHTLEGQAWNLDDDWRRWLFGALILVALVALLVGFYFLIPLVLPKHGK